MRFPFHFEVDAGDLFGTGGEQDSLTAAYLVSMMDKLGYDVVTIGERDLSFGQEFLLNCFKGTKIDLVSANLVYADTRKHFVRPYVIRKAGSVRVAFIGLIGTELKVRRLSSERELEVLDPVETAKKLVPELRKRADVIVLLSHLGLTAGQRFTLEVPGIDAMVFGHQAGLFRSVVQTQGVINVRGGDRGQHIPTIHLVVEGGKITSFDGEVVVLDGKVPDDDDMRQSVDRFSDALNARFSKANAASADAAARAPAAQISADHYLGETTCRRCHEVEYQKYSSQAHAHAFETLVKDQREATPECLPCHVVGYRKPGGFVSKMATPNLINVQCESCHGTGTNHPTAEAFVGPDICLSCHTQENDPDFNYEAALSKIIHWQ